MIKTIGQLIVKSQIRNELGASHFDVAPNIFIDFIHDVPSFIRSFNLSAWKDQIGAIAWKSLLRSDWATGNWCVSLEMDGQKEDAVFLRLNHYWNALKLAIDDAGDIDAFFFVGLEENGIYRPSDMYEHETWYSGISASKESILNQNKFDLWIKMATKLWRLQAVPELFERTKLQREGMALFCKGLNDWEDVVRLKYFELAAKAINRSTTEIQSDPKKGCEIEQLVRKSFNSIFISIEV